MKQICAFIIGISLLIASPAFAESVKYFSALPDLPVATGLTEDAQGAVRFDQPEGRIVVLQATGKVDKGAITGFYQKTLPALGWRVEGVGRFTRGSETLILEVNPLNSTVMRLNILLRPN